MRSTIVLIIVFLLLVSACKKQQVPSVDQQRMINILVDIHLVEASLLGFSEEQKDSLSDLYYHQIYEIHSITEDSFLNEMKFLKSHPDYMIETYEKVLEEISKRENELK